MSQSNKIIAKPYLIVIIMHRHTGYCTEIALNNSVKKLHADCRKKKK